MPPVPARVLTQHNDLGRTGTNLNETILNASNVNVNQFGRLFTHAVQGQIYAQPLYVPFLPITGKGVHNVVFVATMDNWLYAFDADDNSGSNAQPLWAHQVHNNPIPAHIFRTDYQDVVGNIGILSTPVIDATIGTSATAPSSGTMYLVLITWDPALFASSAHPETAFKHLLYAIDLADGQPRASTSAQPNPVEISGAVPGAGYGDPAARATDLPVDKSGGAARVKVKVNNKEFVVTDAEGGQVKFISMQQLQRPGLLLLDGVLYIAFGSHGDHDPYHGWVFAYDAQNFQRRGIFCATPNGGRAGIWQAAEGLVAAADGSIYLGTGNGDSKTKLGSQPDLGESYVRLKRNAGGLPLTGWITLIRNPANPLEDDDLGAASPTLLPDGRLVGGGKDGNFYLLDPAQLDLNGSAAAIAQVYLASRGPGSRARVVLAGHELSTHHIHGSPVAYDSPQHGPLVYVWGENDVLRAYGYDPAAHTFPDQPNLKDAESTPAARGTLFASNDELLRNGMPGAMLSLSADGKTPGTALLWASLPPFQNANRQVVDGELVAYDAAQFDSSQPNGQRRLVALWKSHQNPPADDYGKFAKFCCPTIANGKVYQATFSGRLNVYGLRATPDGGYDFAFGGRTGLTLNGSARSDGGPLRLAGRRFFQAGSVFCTVPVDVRTFNTTFRFRLAHAHADGFTFTIQGEGPHALGGPGGGLGYGPDPTDPLDPGFRITKSVAVKFDLYDNPSGQERSTTGLYQNGASPSGGVTEVALNPLGIDLHSGHFFRATIAYDGATLSLTLRDEQMALNVTRSFPVDVPAITGPTAHVGFTAGTGGLTAEHDIFSWDFT